MHIWYCIFKGYFNMHIYTYICIFIYALCILGGKLHILCTCHWGTLWNSTGMQELVKAFGHDQFKYLWQPFTSYCILTQSESVLLFPADCGDCASSYPGPFSLINIFIAEECAQYKHSFFASCSSLSSSALIISSRLWKSQR